MADKYLIAGNTAAYTAATLTVASAEMNTPFIQADADKQRQLMFRAGAVLYYGRVGVYVSGTSVTLLAGGRLPEGDATIDEMFLLDLSEEHTYQQYREELLAKIKDEEGRLSTAAGGDIEKTLARAVAAHARNKPLYVRKKAAGTGTESYNLRTVLGSLWIHGCSQIKSIEFPAGENPRAMLRSDEWEVYDDGTAQDGSNTVLRFTHDEPAATQFFVVEFSTEPDLPPAGVKNFPDTDESFHAITTLAAVYACQMLAAAYAQDISNGANAAIVLSGDKSGRYAALAREYQRQYNIAVFGSAEPAASARAAMTDKRVEKTASDNRSFVFDRFRNRP